MEGAFGAAVGGGRLWTGWTRNGSDGAVCVERVNRWGLCLILAALMAPDPCAAQKATPAFLRRPDIHGETIVFTAEGDLWLGSLRDHVARRITAHPGLETAAHFSPDGASLAFTGQYDGGTDVYVMPVAGGAPRRLTWDPTGARVVGWTPDGAGVLFRSRRGNAERGNRLFRVPAAGGGATLL